ncbi:L-rhamnose mutarotase [Leucobacter komagatae]|uniref:L-rhamnose 1-epimerase n=1 Tax=Leucobacter komagatae TaxID=55969 RepID=A0A0D0H359_9MICO|nr:L-rhamnose mutarotase [Leucobacter komagatae]KIP51550.1 L-rhamnose 1-epimerase [Leucobacter komagatae]
MKRVAQVIGVPPQHWEAYERYHAAVWPTVLEQIALSNIQNYSIYRHGELLFSYFEYVGDDYEADMARMAADPETQRWWSLQQPLQRPLEGRAEGEWWAEMAEVFHQD